MIGVVPDTDLLPFKIQQPRADKTKPVVDYKKFPSPKDNKANKFSEMLQQQMAINENKENSTDKVVSDGNVELNSLFSTTQSLKKEKKFKIFPNRGFIVSRCFQLVAAVNKWIKRGNSKG